MVFGDDYFLAQRMAQARQAEDDAKFYSQLQFDAQMRQLNATLNPGGIDEYLRELVLPSLLKSWLWDW